MILVCPTCRTRYKVDDEAVSRSGGRTVRCANCGHSWHYMAPPAPLVPSRDGIEATEPSDLPITPRPAITAPPSPRQRRGSGFGGAVAILVIGGVIIAAIVGRNQVVAMWPQAAPYYNIVGLRTGPG